MTDHECIVCKAQVEADPGTVRAARPIATAVGETKRCATHLREFNRHRRKQARARSIERTYDISAEDAHELFLLQLGRCWLCQRATGAAKSLAVDHDHQTDEVRGRLCGPCNQFIGRLGDDPEAAKRLVSYLTGDTPYRRMKAKQALEAHFGGKMEIEVFRVWALGDELFADWRFAGAPNWLQWRVRRADGVWSSQPHSEVADSEPRVETPGECPSCHALPDQPHTEYCRG